MTLHAVTAPFPGVTEWFRHGAAEGFWDLTVIEGDATDLAAAADASVVLLGAWHPAYRQILPVLRDHGVDEIHVAWSSSPIEVDQTPAERETVQALAQGELDIDRVACLHPGMTTVFPDAYHLPAPVHVEDHDPTPHHDREGVGLYVPSTPKKNILPQIHAVHHLQQQGDDGEPHLWTNTEGYSSDLDAYGVSYTQEDWLSRDDLLERLGGLRAVLHASIAESFGYGAVDAMQVGTPVLGSPTLPWLPSGWCVRNPNNVHGIAGRLDRLASDGAAWRPRAVLDDLQNFANRQNTQVREHLDAVGLGQNS